MTRKSPTPIKVQKPWRPLDMLSFAALTAFTLLFLFPFVWMFTNAVRRNNEVLAVPPKFFPSSWEWGNVAKAPVELPFGQFFINSSVMGIGVTAITVVVSAMAAYAFARLRFPGCEGDLLDRFPFELSGGQRQRVAMGRAIVRNPAVFLFDEQLSNLDAKLRVQMRGEIKARRQRVGSTMVYVTHDQIEAMTMADRIVVTRDGHIEQAAAPLELYDEPANIFVATFLGSPSMNLLPAIVRNGALHGPAGGVWAMPQAAGLRQEQAGTVGVRPEHLEIVDSGMSGRVGLIGPTGAETHVLIDIGGSQVTAAMRDRVNFRAGDTIALGSALAKTYVFDAGTGQRIHA